MIQIQILQEATGNSLLGDLVTPIDTYWLGAPPEDRNSWYMIYIYMMFFEGARFWTFIFFPLVFREFR